MLTPAQTKAIQLLGSGVSPEHTAAAVGVTPSLVSQWLAEESFASLVTEEKYKKLTVHNARDDSLDSLEDILIEKLKSTLQFCFRPMELVKAFQVINAAKRRGTSELSPVHNHQQIVSISLPTQIINTIQLTPQGMVTKVGEQSLITMQSGALLRRVQNDDLKARTLASPESAAGTKQTESTLNPEELKVLVGL